jgi:hypothetical protein
MSNLSTALPSRKNAALLCVVRMQAWKFCLSRRGKPIFARLIVRIILQESKLIYRRCQGKWIQPKSRNYKEVRLLLCIHFFILAKLTSALSSCVNCISYLYTFLNQYIDLRELSGNCFSFPELLELTSLCPGTGDFSVAGFSPTLSEYSCSLKVYI